MIAAAALATLAALALAASSSLRSLTTTPSPCPPARPPARLPLSTPLCHRCAVSARAHPALLPPCHPRACLCINCRRACHAFVRRYFSLRALRSRSLRNCKLAAHLQVSHARSRSTPPRLRTAPTQLRADRRRLLSLDIAERLCASTTCFSTRATALLCVLHLSAVVLCRSPRVGASRARSATRREERARGVSSLLCFQFFF